MQVAGAWYGAGTRCILAPVSDLERFARRLREEPGFSRNRRFDELSRPEAVKLRRRLRRLDGIARELKTAEQVTLRAEDGGYRLVLSFPSVRMRRETWLHADEHALLVLDGRLDERMPASTPDAA